MIDEDVLTKILGNQQAQLIELLEITKLMADRIMQLEDVIKELETQVKTCK